MLLYKYAAFRGRSHPFPWMEGFRRMNHIKKKARQGGEGEKDEDKMKENEEDDNCN